MPGDEVIAAPDLVMDRRLDLAAPPAEVWPWLDQLGKRRGGWYMPRLVERFVPRSRRALRHLDASLQGLAVGDVIPDWGPGDPTFEVLAIEEPSHIVFGSERPRRPQRGSPRPPMRLTWALALTPNDPDRTDLRLRLRLDLGHPAGPLPRYGGDLLDRVTVALLGAGLNERLQTERQ
jgi:hypothetical protein